MSLQNSVACLGPAGTHSEAATKQLLPAAKLIYHSTIASAINALENGEAIFGVVPIENSLEGSINITLDSMAKNPILTITKELVWPIHHHLLAKNISSPISKIFSHPQALAQCRETLKKLYPEAEIQEVNSTSEGAEIAAKNSCFAAVAAKEAAEVNGLLIRHRDIQDTPLNRTRFILLTKQAFTKAEPRAAKTSLVCELDGSKAGILYELLKEFAQRNVNLVRIESRPARTILGRYIFFLDIDGSSSSKNVAEALKAIESHVLWARILGSYPVLQMQ